MKTITVLFIFLFAIGAVAQQGQGTVPPTVVVCRGVLDSPISTATAKPGQEVHIKLREGCKSPEFQLAKNTDLVVAVAEAEPVGPTKPGMLHFIFDRAVSDKGQATPVIGILQAIAPKDMRVARGGGRNTVESPNAPIATTAGVGGTAGAAAMQGSTMSGTFGSYEGPADWRSELKTDETGVIGFKQFELQNDRSFPGTKLVSKKDFTLAAGTQFIIRAMKKP
jgi:hypothetical protein